MILPPKVTADEKKTQILLQLLLQPTNENIVDTKERVNLLTHYAQPHYWKIAILSNFILHKKVIIK